MRFLGFLTRRIVGIAAVMVGVSIITFAISHVIPADPVAAALGDHATDQQIAAFRAEYHLDRPLPEQYLTYVVGLAHGELALALDYEIELVLLGVRVSAVRLAGLEAVQSEE